MQHDISIPIDNVELKGILCVPKTAKGFVIFVHGSGSSRLSARNQFVAEGLNSQNLGTLLFDLLTSEEEQIDNVTRELRFNIGFLTNPHEQPCPPRIMRVSDNVDTSTPSGRFFFHVMASLAQMERELMAERTKAGLAAAKSKGRIGGRKRKMTQSKIDSAKQLLANGTPPKDVAQNLGISVPTLYRWLPASTLDLDNINRDSGKR